MFHLLTQHFCLKLQGSKILPLFAQHVIIAFRGAISLIGMVSKTSFSFNQGATCFGHIQKIVLQIGMGPLHQSVILSQPLLGESARAFPLHFKNPCNLFEIFADDCHGREDIPTTSCLLNTQEYASRLHTINAHRYEKIKEYASFFHIKIISTNFHVLYALSSLHSMRPHLQLEASGAHLVLQQSG